jgi:hypothetical protein
MEGFIHSRFTSIIVGYHHHLSDLQSALLSTRPVYLSLGGVSLFIFPLFCFRYALHFPGFWERFALPG